MVMRSPTLEELSFVAMLLIAAASLLFGGILPGIVFLFVAVYAGVVLWTPLRRYLWIPGRRESAILPLVDRLKPTLSEGTALVQQLDPATPSLEVLQAARAWQKASYDMLAPERRDLAERFLDAALPIEERETRSLSTINTAHQSVTEQVACLEAIIEGLEDDP